MANGDDGKRASEPLDPRQSSRLSAYMIIVSLLDQAFRVPGTRWRFGLDALIGLVPGAGDVATAVVGAYGLFVANQLGAPASIQLRMLLNLSVDAVFGAIPLLGRRVRLRVQIPHAECEVAAGMARETALGAPLQLAAADRDSRRVLCADRVYGVAGHRGRDGAVSSRRARLQLKAARSSERAPRARRRAAVRTSHAHLKPRHHATRSLLRWSAPGHRAAGESAAR